MSTYDGLPAIAALTYPRPLDIITYLSRHPHGSTVEEVVKGLKDLESGVRDSLDNLEKAHMVNNANGRFTIDRLGLVGHINGLSVPSEYYDQLQRDPPYTG